MYVTKRGGGRQATIPMFPWTGDLRPYPVSPTMPVPKDIVKPEWARHPRGLAEKEAKSPQQVISVERSAADIQGLREACRVAREVLDAAHAAVAPGVTTDEIDKVVHEETVKRASFLRMRISRPFVTSRPHTIPPKRIRLPHRFLSKSTGGAYPSPLNYYQFPKSVCTSINEVICHGIPDQRPLQEGDIVNVDVSVFYNGFHGDVNETYCVGECDEESKRCGLAKELWEKTPSETRISVFSHFVLHPTHSLNA